MKNSKILSAVTAVAMVLTLTACNNGTTSSERSSSSSFSSGISETPENDFYREYSIKRDVIIINGYKGNNDVVMIPSEIDGKKVAEIAGFRGRGVLKSVTIPESVTTIGDRAFSDSTVLTEINVDDNNPSYTSKDGVLYSKDMTSLICCPGGKIGNFTIPDSVTKIVEEAFRGCTGLTSISIPDSVTEIGDLAFYDCTGLTSITIPDSVTEIGNSAFERCTGLTSITIPSSVTAIGGYTFSSCTGLTSITIPDSVTEIGIETFEDCTGLTSVIIPNSVTEIGENAFFHCTGLTSVIIPDSVTEIGDDAFLYCKAEITYKDKTYTSDNYYNELYKAINGN